MITRRPTAIGILALAAGVMLLAGGCGASGGNTTCSNYAQMDSSQQQSTVIAMMKAHGDPTPSAGDVSDMEFAVNVYCNMNGGNAQIGGQYQAG
jgi:hypothetical protein